MATKQQITDFLDTIAPLVMETCLNRVKLDFSWVLPSVAIAQAACESAWGTSTKMVNANALFGIKVGKSKSHFGTAWKDKAYSTKTKECYDGKTYVEITDMFRAYDSIKDSIEDYYDMLATCSRYKACLYQTDAETAITAIKEGGYATSPSYVSTIMSIIDKHNLLKYDYIVTGIVNRKTLKIWTLGEDVTYLQEALVQLGYSLGKIDGIYGPKTQQAVEKFQSDNKLKIDGICGPLTWAKVESLL